MSKVLLIVTVICLAAPGSKVYATGLPSEPNPFLLAGRTQVLPIITEEKKERQALRGEMMAALEKARVERDALRREIVKSRMETQRLRFESETARYEQGMWMRLAGSIAILVVGILGSLIVGLWQSVRDLRSGGKRPTSRASLTGFLRRQTDA